MKPFSKRGPVPQPYSPKHADLVPEVSRQGGAYSFFHDRGDDYGPPEWLVNGEVISMQRDVLPRLLQVRGLVVSEDAKKDDERIQKAAQCCFDYWLAYSGYNILHEKPDRWDESPILSGYEWCEPWFEIAANEQHENKWLCRIVSWQRELKQTGGPGGVRYGNHPPTMPEPLKCWICWEKGFTSISISLLGSGKNEADQPGFVLTGGRINAADGRAIAFKTTEDEMEQWNERDQYFD
jgi:hypothetical protein